MASRNARPDLGGSGSGQRGFPAESVKPTPPCVGSGRIFPELSCHQSMAFENGRSAGNGLRKWMLSGDCLGGGSPGVFQGGGAGRFVFRGGGAGWFGGTDLPCVPKKKTKRKNTNVNATDWCKNLGVNFGCKCSSPLKVLFQNQPI
jgi:hypothetical protein